MCIIDRLAPESVESIVSCSQSADAKMANDEANSMIYKPHIDTSHCAEMNALPHDGHHISFPCCELLKVIGCNTRRSLTGLIFTSLMIPASNQQELAENTHFVSCDWLITTSILTFVLQETRIGITQHWTHCARSRRSSAAAVVAVITTSCPPHRPNSPA